MCLHGGFYVQASVLSAIVAPIPGDLYVENRVIATFRCTSWTCTWRLMAFVAGGADWGHWGMAGLGKSLWEGRR